MVELDVIGKIEAGYDGPRGQASLGEAYALLRQRWQEGARDLETALRLMFLAWYTNCEPIHLTGLPADEPTTPLFNEIFDQVDGPGCTDPQFYFVVGFMAELFPWACGDEKVWAERARTCKARYEQLGGPKFNAEDFAGRGAFGSYFAHMIGVSSR
jgi:hypothetical protein